MDKWIKNFIKNNKSLVGMSDWKIFISKENLPVGHLAEISPDILEKEAYLELSESFFEIPKKRQKNVLLHELIHCRVLIYILEIKEFSESREEHMVNDLARGIEKLI